MITLNSTILSINKIKEIEEYRPILPPDSIYIPQESNNRSFQKFIPDIYDLDKIEFNDLKPQRNSGPILRNQTTLNNYFLNSMIMMQNDKKDKYIESFPINIYSNDKEKSIININTYKETEQIENTNIYQNQKNKINDDIINNINNINNLNQNKVIDKKKKKNIGISIEINKEKIEQILDTNNNKNTDIDISSEANKEEIITTKNDISTPNLYKDLLNSKQKNSNKNSNTKNKSRKKDIKNINLLEKKSIQSAQVLFSYKNLIRKDPNEENTFIINTSFYKRTRNKKDNNTSKIQTEINRESRNSFNSFLKFEESSKDQNLINLKLNHNNPKNKKEGIIKQFINSENNININNSKLDQSNINSLIIINNSNTNIILNNSKLDQSDINNINNKSNINIMDKIDNNFENEKNKEHDEEEEDVIITEERKSVQCNNLNNYTFRTGESNINNIVNYNNLDNKQQNNNLNNIKYNSHSIFDILGNSKNSNNIFNPKSNIGSLSSLKKLNFDFPQIKESEYSKDEDKKSNNIINNNEENNKKENNNKNKIDLNINIKFTNLKKISKNKGLFNILTFLDCYDLMNLLQTNKSLIYLINKSISDAYYPIIKSHLSKYKSYFELIKCSLVYSKIKETIKIDFVINIRFVNKILKKKINEENNNYYILEKEKNYEPKCFQIIYFYNYFKSINPQKKLKTKENTRIVNMYDYYTYDLYSEYDKLPTIYINKEQSSFNNTTDKLAFIQPILPFKINDKGIINLEIYTSNNDFINPSSIKIILNSFNLKRYINDLTIKGYNNLRICEYENICFHWKFINNEKSKNIFNDIIVKIKKNFENFFNIVNISYETIGFYIFKINLVAVKPGKIENYKMDDDLGINIIIRKKDEIIENEIKKNNLLLERRDIYELRVGDNLTLYLTTKQKKNIIKNKKK